MVTAAIASYGTTLKVGGVAGAVIAELTNIGGIELTADMLDVTSHQSGANAYREFIRGLKDGGEITIEGNFIAGDTPGQFAMSTNFEAGTLQDWAITFPAATATVWTFKGIVSKFKASADSFDGKLSFSASIKVSGKPALGITYSADITDMVFTDSVGVKTSLPAFVGSTYYYSVTIATASDWIKLTVDDNTAVTISAVCLGVEHLLSDDAISEQIIVGGAVSTTTLTVTVTDAGKAPKVYTIHVVRP